MDKYITPFPVNAQNLTSTVALDKEVNNVILHFAPVAQITYNPSIKNAPFWVGPTFSSSVSVSYSLDNNCYEVFIKPHTPGLHPDQALRMINQIKVISAICITLNKMLDAHQSNYIKNQL